jgi:hypothetical protein
LRQRGRPHTTAEVNIFAFAAGSMTVPAGPLSLVARQYLSDIGVTGLWPHLLTAFSQKKAEGNST